MIALQRHWSGRSSILFGIIAAFLLVCSMLPISPAFADAVIRTQAMNAATIAEFYIDETEIRLEIEIGLSDLAAFQSLLPDDIHQGMEFGSVPYLDRIRRFTEEEFVMRADGTRLKGVLKRIGPAYRVKRDAITGEPLASQAEADRIVKAQIIWPFESAPERLEIRVALPDIASIGFVAYHKGVAVNDFRYLTAFQTLDLDWQDPWYTAFKSRSLRRQYAEPMMGFIYVEPYEVRKEIIVRPKDLQRFVDLGIEGLASIPVELQAGIREKAIEFLMNHHPVVIDGVEAVPTMVRADFLERTLRTSRVIDPPEVLDINAAIMGVKFIYPHKGFADSVTMKWDLFDQKITTVPVSAVDPLGAMPQFMAPDYDTLSWQNFIRIPVMPQMADIAAPPTRLVQWLENGRWLLVVFAGLLTAYFVWSIAKNGRVVVSGILAVTGVLLAMGGWWMGSQARLDDAAARVMVNGLLTNIYRAFDFKAEEDVYDVLALSVEGDLLREVYLEMRRGLVLASQGGASARVKQVELVSLNTEPDGASGIRAEVTWQIRAAVGHWGHIHERRNQYKAKLALKPVGGAWKLVEIEIQDEMRL